VKVAHICPQLRYHGGTEKFVMEVDQELRKMGVESRIYSLGFYPRPALLSNIALSGILAERAVKKGYDALIFHQGHTASAFVRNAKTISYFHQVQYDDLAGDGVSYSLYKNVLAAAERHLAHIICNSKYAASRMREILPRTEVDTVYPGVRSPMEDISKIDAQEFCYYHSRIHPRKNQGFLLNVFEKLPYRLLLTGGTWDRRFRKYQEDLQRDVSRMPNVKISTDISEGRYHDLLARSILYCFPAQSEPFGIALLEAMSYGRAVVALDSGATAEVLGDAGVLCKNEVHDWRAAITKLVLDREYRKLLCLKSIARAKEFSWERTARELIAIIERID
jgi:glycosyltransferase involved in cell wall biosynthesis